MLFVVLILTGSRSGFLAAVVAITICIIKSKHKTIGIVLAVIAAVVLWAQMDDMSKERYASMVDENAKGRESAVGRIGHIEKAFGMFSQKPIFGFGIGTFAEANYNLTGEVLVSHNLYTGVLVELGIIGFIIFFMYIYAIFKNLKRIKNKYYSTTGNDHYPLIIADFMEAILLTALAFAMWAGNSGYYLWYLSGGLSVAALRIANKISSNHSQRVPSMTKRG
jgi:O-antigen ligase